MKKRICAVIMCLLLAVNLVGTPKAKAVVSEGALLGSIFGSLLVSLGYSWAADNFDAPSFGEAIYDLIKQCDEEMDTGIQLLIDSNLTGLVATGPGKLQLNYQWVSLARSFADWFQSKFFSNDDATAVVFSDSFIRLANGTRVYYSPYVSATRGYIDASPYGTVFYASDFPLTLDFGNTQFSIYSDGTSYRYDLVTDGSYIQQAQYLGAISGNNAIHSVTLGLWVDTYLYVGRSQVGSYGNSGETYIFNINLGSLVDLGGINQSLTAEKPQEVHYPDVAEDGSEVYEVTYQGVTATDIEGIIQGAVDQILAGTAAIAGEVTQAQDVPVEPEAPAAGEYAVPGLETIFPFCIPFDIYAFCSALNADPVAPSFEWRMQYAPLDLDYTFVIDLEAFDGVAQVLRTMELLAFCVGLAFWTRHLIRG